MEEKQIGVVSTYFSHVGVAAINDLSKVGRTEFIPYDRVTDIQKFVGGLR